MKDTDKVTLTVGQLRQLVKESNEIIDTENNKSAEKLILKYLADNFWLPGRVLIKHSKELVQLLVDNGFIK